MFKTILFFILAVSTASAQKIEPRHVDTKSNASFRGLSVVDDSVGWVSGSKGWVGITKNGGKNWSFRQVKGFEQCDFRSLYAFNAQHAVIANAGSPAYILFTSDGGTTWQKVYENDDTLAFIDGIDFWDSENGAVYGDPIGLHMLLLNTHDGGKTWTEHPREECPLMSPGEASFAASGTCIKCMGRRNLVVATGGKVSRLLVSKNSGKSWKAISTPILQGAASTGIFTFLPLGKKRWVIAGGDYLHDSLCTANLFFTLNAGKSWEAPATTTRGYRECLAGIDEIEGSKKKKRGCKVNTLFAVGPEGIDISYDAGNKWAPFSDEQQFHVVKKSRSGDLIIMAGGQGKLAVVKKSR
jgi:photosystem II stability/assembly factor-like uncharacterized protein